MKRPLCWLVFIFALGIAVGSAVKLPYISVLILAVVLLIVSSLTIKLGVWFDIFLAAFVFIFGVLHLKSFDALPLCHISRYLKPAQESYTIKGFVISPSVLKDKRVSFFLSTEQFAAAGNTFNCCGDILVYLKGKTEIDYGEELVLTGVLSRPPGARNHSRRSYRDYLYNQRVFYIMRVASPVFLEQLRVNKGNPLMRLALKLKKKSEGVIYKYASGLSAAILEAMILGEKRNIPPLIYDSMVKTGTVHILVVSGFNVGIVGFLILLLLKLLRLPRTIRILIAIPLLILYCLVTGASNPVVRATVMAAIFLCAYLFRRQADIYNSLAIAAIFILAINPRQLFDIGFQLSFSSVIAIVFLYPRLKTVLRLERLKLKALGFIVDGCLVSLSAWLGTMGFVAYYFRIFSPVTVLANLFIVPLATLITLCGFSLLFTGLFFPWSSPFFASSSELAVMLLVQINHFWVTKLSWAYFSRP